MTSFDQFNPFTQAPKGAPLWHRTLSQDVASAVLTNARRCERTGVPRDAFEQAMASELLACAAAVAVGRTSFDHWMQACALAWRATENAAAAGVKRPIGGAS